MCLVFQNRRVGQAVQYSGAIVLVFVLSRYVRLPYKIGRGWRVEAVCVVR